MNHDAPQSWSFFDLNSSTNGIPSEMCFMHIQKFFVEIDYKRSGRQFIAQMAFSPGSSNGNYDAYPYPSNCESL